MIRRIPQNDTEKCMSKLLKVFAKYNNHYFISNSNYICILYMLCICSRYIRIYRNVPSSGNIYVFSHLLKQGLGIQLMYNVYFVESRLPNILVGIRNARRTTQKRNQ